MDLTFRVQVVNDGEQLAFTCGRRKIDALRVQPELGAHLVLTRNVRDTGGVFTNKDNGQTGSQSMLLLQARDLSDGLGVDLLGDGLAVDEFPRHRATITKPCRYVRWRRPGSAPPCASAASRPRERVCPQTSSDSCRRSPGTRPEN